MAADVAAFANGQGGLLLIGAAETADEITHLVPLDTSGQELRIHHVVGGSVVPPLAFSIRVVPSRQGGGYTLVAISPSVRAPHAVVKDDDLRYVVRDGPGKRAMRAPEVAERYRNQFAAAVSRLDRLAHVHQSIQELADSSAPGAWLTISLVPDQAGALPISMAGREEATTWLTEVINATPYPLALQDLISRVTTGFRRYIAGDQHFRDEGQARLYAAEFHRDGAGCITANIGDDWRRGWRSSEEMPQLMTIGDEGLGFTVISMLSLLGGHAVRAGAFGGASVMASIRSSLPVQIGQRRSMAGIGERVGGTRAIAAFEELSRTVPLDSIRTPSADLVSASHLVASDLLSGFGLPESSQLTLAGEIRWPYVNHNYRPSLERWAQRFGIGVRNVPL